MNIKIISVEKREAGWGEVFVHQGRLMVALSSIKNKIE